MLNRGLSFSFQVAYRILQEGLACSEGHRYKLYDKLGSGAYGTVVQAMRDDGRLVAIKIMEEQTEQTASMRNQEVSGDRRIGGREGGGVAELLKVHLLVLL